MYDTNEDILVVRKSDNQNNNIGDGHFIVPKEEWLRGNNGLKSRLQTALESALQTALESALKIIEQINNNPRATITDIANLTGYSRRWVAETMKRLQKLNIIKRIGSDRSGYWVIVNKDEQ